ncbi:thioesterase family protein [Nocardia sp. NPDC056100]|uniref:thioesterase family protein n=1 Tax=Nocardia sp. NPDC056100 TaxID=3345712 RepID=UPI0035E25526
MTRAFFRRLGPHRFEPTPHTGGAWSATEQHVSPLAGLLVHEIEAERSRRDRPTLLASRISVDILGPIAFSPFEIRVDILRPGRTIELVQATAMIDGRDTVTARAWFACVEDTDAAAGGEPERLPAPDALAEWPLSQVWEGGYIASIDMRPIGIPQPGRTTAWVSTDVELLAGEPVSELAAYIGLVDTANGIAVRQEPAKWLFPNLDLTIHLYRQPVGEWVGLDTTVVFGRDGQGVTSSVLHDLDGPVGIAQQTLTVRPREVGQLTTEAPTSASA